MPPDCPDALVRAEPLLLKETDAAEILGVSPRTLWAMRASGELPFVKLRGSMVRYRMDDLRRYVSRLPEGGRP